MIVAGVKNTHRTSPGASFALVCVVCAIATPLQAAAPVVPDERDRQVLETLLLHLLADPKFDMTRVSTNGATIVLHRRTPEKTGFLDWCIMRPDIGDPTLPTDVEEDLRRRNCVPDGHDCVASSFIDLKFAQGIVVTNLPDVHGVHSYSAFEKVQPKARGWVEAYLPGYSKDGSQAVVRGFVGPFTHSVVVTALLEKRNDKWVVKWHQVVYTG